MKKCNGRRFEKQGEESMNKRIAPKKKKVPSGEEDK
jgi:hypothetical protein